jgi:sugar/nucleoside kinase (ribokinase family)
MSTPSELDVIAIGNALVDVLTHQDDLFLADYDLVKGTMALIDADRAEVLYGVMGPGIEISGGSAANTAVGIASLGGSAAFIGRVNDDQLGEVFAHDIQAAGVRFETPPASGGLPTGRCLIVVTPDAERTLNTFLGAAAEIGPEDVSAEMIASAQVTYLEGYLFDQDRAKTAFRQAAKYAHDADRRVALTLSDSFCVERHRADFLSLVETSTDILFANEAEICALYEVDDFDTAIDRVDDHCEIAAITRGAKGATIVSSGKAHLIDPHPVPGGVLDTTGAGDLYAAGFLFGITNGYDVERSGQLASLAASEAISHLGARPETSLSELASSLLR